MMLEGSAGYFHSRASTELSKERCGYGRTAAELVCPFGAKCTRPRAATLSPIYDPQVFARAKILALIEYIYRLQAK